MTGNVADPAWQQQLTDVAPLALADALLTPALLRLEGPAGTVDLEPLVVRLLLLLGSQAGTVIARGAIMDQLWPTTVVADDSLHRVIALARRALGACTSAVMIETVPRTGYRLVAAAHETAAGLSEAPAVDAARSLPLPALPQRAQVTRRGLMALTLGAGLAAAAAGVWRAQSLPAAENPARPARPARVAALADQAVAMARLAEADAERQGVGLLREAVQLAPDDADLWGQLALALRAVAEYAPPPRVASAFAQSQSAARRALALDSGQPDARAALVQMLPLHGNWWRAEQGFRAILRDAPDHLPSLDGLAQLQASAGLLALHYPLRQRSVTLDPLHAGYNFRSIYAHWMNGNLAAADRAGTRGLELWPRHNATWNARMGLFAMSGRPERALAMLADEAGRPPLPPAYLAMLDAALRGLADAGPTARAQAVDNLTNQVAGGGPFMAVIGSMLLAALGAPDRALQVVDGFLLERGPIMVEPNWRPGQILHNDVRRRFTNFLFTPVMAPVRSLPGFAVLTKAIGLDAYWQQSGQQPEHLMVGD
jgi:DNA-binding winged helix-turn-helix (wHTH) protein